MAVWGGTRRASGSQLGQAPCGARCLPPRQLHPAGEVAGFNRRGMLKPIRRGGLGQGPKDSPVGTLEGDVPLRRVHIAGSLRSFGSKCSLRTDGRVCSVPPSCCNIFVLA